MENQTGGVSPEARPQTFQQPAPGYPPLYPPTMPPGYLPGYQQAFPQMPPPVYPMSQAPDLPPSPYPLQTPGQQNTPAILGIILGALAGVMHYILYAFFYMRLVATTSRAQEVTVYQTTALLQIVPLFVAGGALVCGIVALSQAKAHAWNGLTVAKIYYYVALHALSRTRFLTDAVESKARMGRGCDVRNAMEPDQPA